MNATTDIVAKLWNLCNVLRDDGITYQAFYGIELVQDAHRLLLMNIITSLKLLLLSCQ